MNNKRNLAYFSGAVILLAALVSGFVLMQPAPQEMLVQALETAKTITDGHAVVAINVDGIDKDFSGKVEVWGMRGEDGPGAFRLEVLESSEAKAQGALIVSDGDTLWAYSPVENKVFVGTPEEAKSLMEKSETMGGEFFPHKEGNFADGEHEHPETAEEAVEMLLEYFNASKSGTEEVAGDTANVLKMEPIPEQMPSEYAAVGGFINLWIGQNSQLPLAVEYTGGSLGSGSLRVLELDINQGVGSVDFSFEVPTGAEVVTFADIEPQSLTLEQASETTEFDFLTPAETPAGATLVDIIEVRGAIAQRYALPNGGSFSIAQGIVDSSEDLPTPSSEGQSVEVRGVTGSLFVSEDGSQVMLTWIDGNLFYSVAGDLSTEQALALAESLQ